MKGGNGGSNDECWAYGSDLLVVGIVRYVFEYYEVILSKSLTGITKKAITQP